MPTKLTYEYIKNYFKTQNCKLISTEYKNCDTKLKYKCKCGNESEITFSKFKRRNQRCKKCGKNEKLTYEYVKDFFEKRNCKLLETEYINANTKMKYQCICGNISEIAFGCFQKGTKCLKCNGNVKHNYKYIYDYFKKQNCKLLESEYINVKTKMKYLCECKNEAFTTFNNFQQGHKCNFCKHKTQAKLFNWLKEIFINYTIETEKVFDWSKHNKSYKRYDFYIKELNLIIELDGRQHFTQVWNWNSPEKQTEKDLFKNKLAIDNGFRIIRICQQIVWNNKEEWDIKLKNAINSEEELIKIGSVYKISGE